LQVLHLRHTQPATGQGGLSHAYHCLPASYICLACYS